MISTEVILINKTGLHARPAALFVKEASKYKSNINIIKGEKTYNAKSIMGLLSMGAAKGDSIKIETDGEDEEIALNNLVELLNSYVE